MCVVPLYSGIGTVASSCLIRMHNHPGEQEGHRLGRGKGYYDKYFARYESSMGDNGE